MDRRRLLWRWRDIFRRRRLDRELDEEINAHIAIEVQRRIEMGESREKARTAALREIRSPAFVKEATREVWAWATCERLAQDLRYAARMLLKTPAFTCIAILSLALGIGANTAIFSMINAVLLQNLPVSNPQQLVVLTSFQRNGPVGNFAYPDYQRLQDGNQVFSGLLAASRPTPVNAGVDNKPERALAQIVSGNYFSVLGVSAVVGRTFMGEERNSRVAVISHGYWRRAFGGDPGVLGKALAVNGSVFNIIGVTPPEFFGETVGQSPDIWVPLDMWQTVRPSPFDLRTARFVTWLYLMGRLKPDMGIEQASAEAQGLVAGIHGDVGTDPERDYLHHIVMEPGSRGSAGLRNSFSAVLLVAMAVVAFVLLIACTNLASLLLARAASRQREIATRLALGASRLRLIRQLLTESVLLTVLAGGLGLLFAAWMNRSLLSLVAEGVGSITLSLYPDIRVLLFSLVVSVLAGVAFGLVPALQAVRIDLGPKLKMNAPGHAYCARSWGLRNVLLTAQVALSLTLVAGGLLFTRTLWNLKTLDTGFRPENVLLIGFGPQDRPETDLAARLFQRVSAIPGVRSVTVSVNMPLGNTGSGVNGLEIQGYTPQTEEDQRARADWVGPRYFETLGVPILEGREFSLADTVNSQRVAIVNETMARFYFGQGRALGKRLRFNKQEYEIIGIARDAKYTDLRGSTPRLLYFAFLQNPTMVNTLELRTAGPPLELVGAVRGAIREVDARLNIRDIASMSDLINRKLLPEYLVAVLSAFFSSLILLLACIGIYGTLTCTVTGRTNEIGIRMALGAQRTSVLLLIQRDILRPLAIGLGLGILLVLALGPLVASILFGLQPHDASTIALAVLLLGIAALAAGYVPARRATRVDPVAALRCE